MLHGVPQVVDRPTQGHRFLSRQYVQPQWVLDAANWRVLPDPSRYAPGVKPPPHLSPFVNDDDEGYVPDYAVELRRLQVSYRMPVSLSCSCHAKLLKVRAQSCVLSHFTARCAAGSGDGGTMAGWGAGGRRAVHC